MTLFFPDINVWLALSDESHPHHEAAQNWFQNLPASSRLLFSRYTQLALLRLLTNPTVMDKQVLTIQQAWNVFDRWMADLLVNFHPEPLNIESTFREATLSTVAKNASNRIGDCYLLASAKASGATLVTFDKGLLALAAKRHCRAVRC